MAAVRPATPSSSPSSQHARGCPRFGIKKEIEGIKYAGGRPPTLEFISRDKSGAEPSSRRNTRENTRVANVETEQSREENRKEETEMRLRRGDYRLIDMSPSY